MNEAQVRTVQQIRQVLAGTRELGFSPAQDDQQRCDWIESVLKRLHYRQLGRADRGVVLAYLRHLSGYSRAQINRLVARAMTRNTPLTKRYYATTACFARRYTDADVLLLIEVDQAMGIRALNVIDDFNREALGIEVDFSLPSTRVIRTLEQIIDWRGKPAVLRCDNGPEYHPFQGLATLML